MSYLNKIFNILSILNIKKPKAFILENVQNLKTYQSGEILKQMLKKLRKKQNQIKKK